MSARITIVGGGFAGLIAARSLQAQGITDVTVLERAPEVGGLLRSFVAEDPLGDGRPLAFDRGAHFVLATGAPELDALLLAGVTPERYHVFDDSLPEGQFLNGALSVDSGCADARLFGEEIRARVFAELEERVAAEAPGAAPETLRDELLATYGPTATELIFEPAFVKHAGRPTAALHPSMRQYFAATRVIAADRARSAALKADPKWDARLAFAHHEDGSSSIRKFYPRSGGVGLWIAELAEETAKAGARLLAGAAVSAIEVEAGAARAAVLDTGERIETDHLVWTLPPAGPAAG
ncbi:MAG: FAD-dependent oxidoreductase, partial [Pseudomonadota bacterium]